MKKIRLQIYHKPTDTHRHITIYRKIRETLPLRHCTWATHVAHITYKGSQIYAYLQQDGEWNAVYIEE